MSSTPVHNEPTSRSLSTRIPSVALILTGAAVAALAWFPLSSVDLGYHLAYGRHFLDTGKIVGLDPFLFEENAVPFINANWGSQAILAAVERATGASGLITLRLALIALIFACMAAVLRHVGLGATAIAAAWLLAALGAYERFSLRPELFSYAMMMVMLWRLVRGVSRMRHVALLGILQLAWVNLHSYFLVGVMLTASFLVGSIRIRSRRHALIAAAPAETRLLVTAIGKQLLACVANPFCFQLLFFPIKTLSFLSDRQIMAASPDGSGQPPTSAWGEISEFHSPFAFSGLDICANTIHAYYALLALAVVGAIGLLIGRRIAPLLFLILLTAMSTQMRRNIAQFALAGTPLCMWGLAEIQSAVRRRRATHLAGRSASDDDERSRPARRSQPAQSRGNSSGHGPRSLTVAALFGRSGEARTTTRAGAVISTVMILASAWLLFTVVDGRFYFNERRINRRFGTGYHERFFPIDAVRHMTAMPDIRARWFVDYFSSSNALPWLPKWWQVFVDTNTFAVSEDTLRTAFDVGLGKIDPFAFFDQHRIDAVLLHASTDTQGLIRRLVADPTRWALVYIDHAYMFFMRRTGFDGRPMSIEPIHHESIDADAWIRESRGSDTVRALDLNLSAAVPLLLGWYDRAQLLFAEAVRLRPDYHEAWINLGLCHAMTANAAGRRGERDSTIRELQTAIQCFSTALHHRPDDPIAKENRRRALDSLVSLENR